jgi:RNA polymerase sigma factor (sigma-70 family)
MADDVPVEAFSTPAPAAVPAGPRHGRLVRSLPDPRLVARVRKGDEAAFEAVFDRYHRQLLAFCRHMLGTREEAEDALQHVFVSAHRHLVAGDDRVVELRPWLYAIARNRCLSVLRARREAVALDDVPEPTGGGLEIGDELEQREDLQEVLGDIARLPDDQRAALLLAELGALSHEDVAEVLGVRREKVKALVFQARESLAGWRQARNTDCREIREQLASLRGGALRRGPLRKHLETCEDCREFRSEVRRQREALALVLPVVPGIALKAKVLGAVAAGGHLVPAAGAGAGLGAGLAGTAGAGHAAAGGGLAALGSGLATKALVLAAIAATASGGYVVVRDETPSTHSGSGPPAVHATPSPWAPAAAPPTALPTPDSATPGARRHGAPAARGANGHSTAERGRPAVPGSNGFARAPKAQGLAHRRTDPPAYGAGGSSGAKTFGQTRPVSPRPAHVVRPRPRPALTPAPWADGSRGSGTGSSTAPGALPAAGTTTAPRAQGNAVSQALAKLAGG